MWWREHHLIEIVGVEGDDRHLLGASIGKDNSIRLRTQSYIVHPSSRVSFSPQGSKYLTRHVFVQQKHSWTSYHPLTSSRHFPAHRSNPLCIEPAPGSGA